MELQPSIVIAIISLFYDYNKKKIGGGAKMAEE